ncbi:hypothetical protein LMG22037_05974 [Paraburkholderia phenoliruptrix]|uniref:Uncharacterized protein n=1 Tax=Paraburkholderia phenoliruptrix TaxID=252970 RepID=A0A6J5CHL9_9BURK|nr:hypothetical protein [Paraburkholderia phenoliruptrix]CAB3735522.1 hypothetical protein LMG22037_05974 [Paraburkholderia phenoliruptrix]
MNRKINIFLDPPAQAEIDEALRTDNEYIRANRYEEHTSLGQRIAHGPGLFGIEVLVGAVVHALRDKPQQPVCSDSTWEAWPGALDWDWTESMFTESYANKVRAMGRELARCEVTALADQLALERQAKSVAEQARGSVAETGSALKDAGTIARNIADTIASNVFRQKG